MRIPVKNIRAADVAQALAPYALDGEGTLARQIYLLLRRLAVELELMPNQFLSEKDVAGGLRISKTPVREAFIKLSEDGVVRIQPQSGTYVAGIDLENIEEGFFVWTALGSSCLALLAGRDSLRDIQRLRELLAEETDAAAKNDPERFQHTNNLFYEAVFDMADLPEAKRLNHLAGFEVDRIRNILQMHRLIPMERVVGDHTEMVNAVADSDVPRAEDGMRRHLEGLRETVMRALRSNEFREFLAFLNQKRSAKRKPRGEKAS